MKKEKFFSSKYYGLKEVHRFNLFVQTLKREANAPDDVIDRFLDLLKVRRSYDDVEKFVPGSEKYMKVLEDQMRYRVAQAELREHDFTSEVILDESYPKSLKLTRHTVKVGFEGGTGYDKWEDYKYDYPPGNRWYTFFSKDDWWRQPVKDTDELLLPYNRDGGWDKLDLIEEQLKQYDRLQNEILAYQLAERMKISIWDIKLVFDIHKLTHWTDWTNFVTYGDADNIKYYAHDIIKLIEEAKAAKEKKYIKNDEFVDYPSFTAYMDFKEKMANGEYKEHQYA